MKGQRICIYTKDVMCITGKSERYSRKLLAEIKIKLKKEPKQFITYAEFSSYTGIDISTIEKYLID